MLRLKAPLRRTCFVMIGRRVLALTAGTWNEWTRPQRSTSEKQTCLPPGRRCAASPALSPCTPGPDQPQPEGGGRGLRRRLATVAIGGEPALVPGGGDVPGPGRRPPCAGPRSRADGGGGPAEGAPSPGRPAPAAEGSSHPGGRLRPDLRPGADAARGGGRRPGGGPAGGGAGHSAGPAAAGLRGGAETPSVPLRGPPPPEGGGMTST